MSKMTTTTQTRSFVATLSDQFATVRARMADAAARRKVYRTTLAELEALSDRDLNDLGLSRSMIKSVALDAAYGK